MVVRSLFSMLKLFLLEGWVVDRRVLTADVDAGLGLITRVRKWSSQIARLPPFWRSGTGGTPDSTQPS